jgi:hypothetical protein
MALALSEQPGYVACFAAPQKVIYSGEVQLRLRIRAFSNSVKGNTCCTYPVEAAPGFHASIYTTPVYMSHDVKPVRLLHPWACLRSGAPSAPATLDRRPVVHNLQLT